jgi:hypothetical protein
MWSDRPIGAKLRISMLVGALLFAAPLFVAGYLTPQSDGLGTHQQLGLPPCTIRMLWGVRCPSCGMTTSWAYFVRGQWMLGFRSNIAGVMLAMLATSAVVVFLSGSVIGKMPGHGYLLVLTCGMVLTWMVAIAQWVWRIA